MNTAIRQLCLKSRLLRYVQPEEESSSNDLKILNNVYSINIFLELYAKNRAEGFGPEVKRRIMLGTYVLSSGYYDAYYNTALKARRLIRDEYKKAFEQCDVIAGPTTPTTAFKIGEKSDPMSMYLCDIYTANTNIAGICGISIPCGFSTRHGKPLPIGLHLQGAWHDDAKMLRAAQMFQTETSFNNEPIGAYK